MTLTLDRTLTDILIHGNSFFGFGSHSAIVTVEVSFDRYLPTLNDYIGKNRHVYNKDKIFWSKILGAALYGPTGDVVVTIEREKCKTLYEPLHVEREGELEGVFSRIDVEGHVTYPARNRGPRDNGNARSFLEKVLGDVMQKAGSFEKDDHWDAYEFGRISRSFVPKVSKTKLLIMARPLAVPNVLAGARTLDKPVPMGTVTIA